MALIHLFSTIIGFLFVYSYGQAGEYNCSLYPNGFDDPEITSMLCGFVDSVPETIRQLSNLRTMRLTVRNEGTVATEIGLLSELTSLDIRGNGPPTLIIPTEIGELSILTKLYLSRIATIPSQIGQLQNLVDLGLYTIRDGPIPTAIGNLGGLTHLYLSTAQFVPDLFENLTNLETLSLVLYGTFPASMFRLPKLKDLSISTPSQIPSEISLLAPSLESLTMAAIDIAELVTIPTEIGELTNLKSFTFSLPSYLNQRATLPTEIGLLTLLESLQRGSSGAIIEGTIPTEFGLLENLVSLNLRNNRLTGEIPSQLGNLGRLESLALAYNRLSGNIPSSLGNLKSLTRLHLSNQPNFLNGTLPSSLWQLTNLEYVDLREIKLSGTIPRNIGAKGLTSLVISRNRLSGTIPTEISALSNLTRFDANSNDLSGTIPSQLALLTKLTVLDTSSNKLVGTIPIKIAEMKELSWLRFSDNFLSGCVDDAFLHLCRNDINQGPASGETFCTIHERQFCNPLPLCSSNETCKLAYNCSSWPALPAENLISQITDIDCPNQNLLGSIPSELGDLSTLTNINLSSNRISGAIPSSFSNLEALKSLNLDDNFLTGEFPIEIFEIETLEVLSLSNNSFSGCLERQIYLGNCDADSIPPGNGNVSCSFESVFCVKDSTGDKDDDASSPVGIVFGVLVFIAIIIAFWHVWKKRTFNPQENKDTIQSKA